MMKEEQSLTIVNQDELMATVSKMKQDGQRLVQISCTTLEQFEITYSFDKSYKLSNIRILVDKANPVIKSITDIYGCAFTYENELQDLFGLTVEGLKPDFKRNFYRLAVKAPFASKEKQE